MEREIAKELALKLKININQITREYWEMMILRQISQSKISDFLIFVGGTALRLAYASPRFSDDLDFYLKKKFSFTFFKAEIERIAKTLNLQITDLYKKYFSLLAEFKINVDYLPLPFRIKIEVRKELIKKNFETRLLISPTVNFQVLLYVASLEKIKEMKLKALKERKDPRDLFDLWFISQKLKIPFQPPKVEIDQKFLKQTLYKYLPLDFKKVVENLKK